MTHAIPPITDPLGRYWYQPPLDRVVVDETHALLAEEDFAALYEYSRSYPSGVYPGKMWRAQMRDGTWLLRWYGECEDPKLCSNNQRLVILV